MTRLRSRLLVDLLLRSAGARGGFAAVLAHGDDHGGAILVQCCNRGQPGPLLERQFNGVWGGVGPALGASEGEQAAYVARRRAVDPDLWLIELDIVDAPRFVVELNPVT